LFEERRARVLHSGDDDFVFAAATGEFMHYSRANRLLKSAAALAGVASFKMHDLRRARRSQAPP
jgi:hypothetical protein